MRDEFVFEIVPPSSAAHRPVPRSLSTYRNFRALRASVIVGFKQSNAARRSLLASRYAGTSPTQLAQRAGENLLRAQCMPRSTGASP